MTPKPVERRLGSMPKIIINPKSECRSRVRETCEANPKQIQSTNYKERSRTFGFVSNFGFRTSSFRRLCSCGGCFLHDLVGDVFVGIDILDIVVVFEGVDESERSARGLFVRDSRGRQRQERNFGGLWFDAFRFERFVNRLDLMRVGENFVGVRM